jgi:hypothetical protein
MVALFVSELPVILNVPIVYINVAIFFQPQTRSQTVSQDPALELQPWDPFALIP